MSTAASSSDPSHLAALIPTEQVNPRTVDIDLLPTEAMLQRLNQEDLGVAEAVTKAIPQITPVVDAIVASQAGGGRLFYFGAGTSGRLGVLDASECPPTYGTRPEQVQALIAGGDVALRNAVEGAEDSAELGIKDVRKAGLCAGDVAVGLSASGGAAYVVAAMEAARDLGCVTACITCNGASALHNAVDLPIVVEVGPEPIAGSTRMKAGTAQKLVLNMLTTGAMIQLGKTYRNLMVDVQPTNLKLKNRAMRIVSILGEVTPEVAIELLQQADQEVKTAIVMGQSFKMPHPLDVREARLLLSDSSGKLRQALQKLLQ